MYLLHFSLFVFCGFLSFFFFFFFQAEDGIRDLTVTGVQTCALPIFSALIANVWALVYRSLKFDGFNLTVNQVAVVFPFLLQAPRFFSGAIKLGDVMQTSQAFGQVQDALSFFRTRSEERRVGKECRSR